MVLFYIKYAHQMYSRSFMRVSKDILFQARFEYHKNLVSRRWQYFAMFVAFTGFMFASIKEILNFDPYFRIILSLAVITTSCVFLRLISRSRTRININAKRLNEIANEIILETGKPGSFGLTGITIWLYFCMTLLTIPWFYVVFKVSILLAVVVAFIFLINLIFLKWRLY